MMENENMETEDMEVGNEISEEARRYEEDLEMEDPPPVSLGKGTDTGGTALIYIGPSFPGAKRYTVYTGGLPEALEEKIEAAPIFRGLVVPVERLAGANVELSRSGSGLSILYQKAQETLAGREG
ncbi:MAG: hypothetical protein HFH56_09995 [Lachnospiraceae bacterium]|jgi:hypothetical protein|nr:hypothetical protein [Lachnospiraceae bacterium]